MASSHHSAPGPWEQFPIAAAKKWLHAALHPWQAPHAGHSHCRGLQQLHRSSCIGGTLLRPVSEQLCGGRAPQSCLWSQFKVKKLCDHKAPVSTCAGEGSLPQKWASSPAGAKETSACHSSVVHTEHIGYSLRQMLWRVSSPIPPS